MSEAAALAAPQPLAPPPARPAVHAVLARVLAPRRVLSVSEWADHNRRLSNKGSAEPGRWSTRRNEPLREPMDALSSRSNVHDVVLMFPVQFGKTEVALNVLGYTMDHHPGPVMVCLPGEASLNKWVAQKLNPMIDETPAVKATLVSVASREAANTRTFKDYAGGQLYIEHAGSPARLKSATVRTLIVDELDEFAVSLSSGDDPVEMLNDRTSSYPATHRRLYISSPQMRSTSRIFYLWERSDQRRYHVACPHCGERQPLEWSALHWAAHRSASGARQVWVTCRECGASIEEHHKPALLASGQWVPENPAARTRGYHINCLYYPLGLGPRWADLVEMWLDAQGDPARLKTFVNSRLAEPWEDKSQRHVRANIVAERAEPYALRTAPEGVLRVTAGVDTQDDRLEVQIVGWGRGLAFWVLDYVVLNGDPAQDAVWAALTELLNRPIQHHSGALLSVEATSIDMFGHRTEAVKHYVRSRHIRRPMAAFGATANTAPVLGKGKLHDVTWRGQYDKRGVHIYQVGTVAAKNVLYARLAADADDHTAWSIQPDDENRPPVSPRVCHFSDDLPPEYFTGLISEVFNPTKNRYEKRRGVVRNEPLDTWVHAYAAAHHPEMRLHRATRADWDRWEVALAARVPAAAAAASDQPATVPTSPEKPATAWHSYRSRGQQSRPHKTR